MIFNLTVLAALALLQASASAQPARRVEVYAHRGARAFSPENTLPSFKTALRIGADWLDMDVVLTRENEVLVSHDPVLNPDITRDERGEFLARSREALAKRPPAERLAYDRKFAVRGLTRMAVS
jgi:glycerophosphoryl diester phosphodiesterase